MNSENPAICETAWPEIRHWLVDVCVVTNSESDNIAVAVWGQNDECSIVGTYPVGDGPVGVDLMRPGRHR